MTNTAQEWQPIETAPKNGTDCLLVWCWDSGIHTGVSVILAAWICRKHSYLSSYHDCPNEAGCDMGWSHYAGTMTHWMPLPSPPSLARTPSVSPQVDDERIQRLEAQLNGVMNSLAKSQQEVERLKAEK